MGKLSTAEVSFIKDDSLAQSKGITLVEPYAIARP